MRSACGAATLVVLAIVSVAIWTSADRAEDAASALAAEILSATGVEGGLVVHVGCGDGRLTAALHANERYLVHGLDADPASVRRAREFIQSRGLYGDVSVAQWSGDRLPYAENLVDLLVSEAPLRLPKDELMRVLSPGGVAYIRQIDRWQKIVKPWPEAIDDWTHNLHGPDGNPVAQDRVVGPPRHYQWTAGPQWLRSHDTDSSVSAVVIANGRVFYIIDEAPISLAGNNSPPDRWSLVARDAFNGVLLWKVPIAQWGWREWKDRWYTARTDNLPVNLPRRLVAVGDRVYATLGYHAPVSQLDAATGEILREYDGTDDAREILYCDGALVLSVFRDGRLKVMAMEAESGRLLWQTEPTLKGSEQEYLPRWRRRGDEEGPRVDPALNPAADGQVVCLIDGADVVCLDFATGQQRWRTQVGEEELPAKVGTLIVSDGVVLHADPSRLLALSVQTGEQLWSKPKQKLGHLWFEWKDVFVIRGLVWTWSAECDEREFRAGDKSYRRKWPLYVNGYHPRTGELVRQVSTDPIYNAPHHHRCYRNKATLRYILSSRRGSEYVDLAGREHTVHNWVRGTCHLGMFPAYGLQYVPPHPCVCYIHEKINGFVALAPEIPARHASTPAETPFRLDRGPAYGRAARPEAEADLSGDWPTYRADFMRSGAATTEVAAGLTTRWQASVGGRLSAPTVVGDRVFVSAIDQHRVLAFDADGGDELWCFTAEARVDTPPTWHRGTLLLGSADGSVYCLRETDGELVWRFRAAPRRMIGVEGQLESAWPVHGSVVVQDGLAYFAAGRCSHLDGGIHLYAVDAATGEMIHHRLLTGPRMDSGTMADNVTPEQGRITDIMQGDGERIYMRHMAYNADLTDSDMDVDRIRAVGGFLDDTYFRRAPWRFGARRNWGRVIAYDDHFVYMVRMFESLHGLDPDNFFTPGDKGYRLLANPRQEFSQVAVANSESLSPRDTPLTVEAWVLAEQPDGVVLARGGSAQGYTLLVTGGRPQFAVRINDEVTAASADEQIVGRWVHLAGVLTEEHELQVYIDGRLSATARAPSLLGSPGQATEIGADCQTGVGEYESPFAFTGAIDEVSIYHRALTEAEISGHCAHPGRTDAGDEALVLHFSFDDGTATDGSGQGNSGECRAVEPVEGTSGQALRFVGNVGTGWSLYLPVRVRAMVPAGQRLFVAGPPDVVEPDDPLGAFEGRKGGLLWVFSATSGERLAEYELAAPPVFNGMAAARSRLFLTTVDGRLTCMTPTAGT